MPMEVNRRCAHCRHPRWNHCDPKEVDPDDPVCDYNEGECPGCFGFVEGLDEFICDWSDEAEEIGCAKTATLGDYCPTHGLH